MKIFKEKFDQFKNKRDLIKELKFYREFIFKKLEIEELNSALKKARSALTLIKEHQDLFNMEKELDEFDKINQKVLTELKKHRDIYVKRLNNLLKEKIDDNNLGKIMKLLAALKSEVDKNVGSYNLENLQININDYFKFVKRLYIIMSSYEVVNYFEVSEKIFLFIQDLEFEDFPNLSEFINSLFQELISRRLFELASQFEKLSLSELSDKLALNQEDLEEFIFSIMEEPNSPIKVFNSTTYEVLLRKKD